MTDVGGDMGGSAFPRAPLLGGVAKRLVLALALLLLLKYAVFSSAPLKSVHVLGSVVAAGARTLVEHLSLRVCQRTAEKKIQNHASQQQIRLLAQFRFRERQGYGLH